MIDPDGMRIRKKDDRHILRRCRRPFRLAYRLVILRLDFGDFLEQIG